MSARETQKKSRKWDDRYLQLAQHVSGWSKDPNAHVGAVLVDAQKRVCALGYNGFPRAVEDSGTRLQDKDTKLAMIMHAEANAITIAGRGTVGGELYVFGKPVCAQCAGFIIQSGVKRVIAERPTKGTDSHWDRVGLLAEEVLRETGEIELELIPREELMTRVRSVPLTKGKKSPKDAPLFDHSVGPDGSRPDTRSRYHVVKNTGSAVSTSAGAEPHLGEDANPANRRDGRRRRTR